MHRSKLSTILAHPTKVAIDTAIKHMMDELCHEPCKAKDTIWFCQGGHEWRLTIERLEDGTYDTE